MADLAPPTRAVFRRHSNPEGVKRLWAAPAQAVFEIGRARRRSSNRDRGWGRDKQNKGLRER